MVDEQAIEARMQKSIDTLRKDFTKIRTGNIEFDYKHISLFTGWVVTRCTVDGTHSAVRKGLGIKTSGGLSIPIVP